MKINTYLVAVSLYEEIKRLEEYAAATLTLKLNLAKGGSIELPAKYNTMLTDFQNDLLDEIKNDLAQARAKFDAL